MSKNIPLLKPKIFLLLPDGIGLRNFAFTRFPEIGKLMGYDTVFWNQTDYPVRDELGFEELKITDAKLHPLTTVYSRARKRIELKLWEQQFQDKVYQTYHFPQSYKSLKNAAKSLMVDYLVATKTHPKGLKKVITQIKKQERQTSKYAWCKKQLEAHRPRLFFAPTKDLRKPSHPFWQRKIWAYPRQLLFSVGITCPKPRWCSIPIAILCGAIT